MHTSTLRALLAPVVLFSFTVSAAEVRRPSDEPTKVPLVVGGLFLGVAGVSGAIVLGQALQHAGGCSAAAAVGRFLGGGGCDAFVAGPLGLVSLSALALSGVMFVLQYALSTPPPRPALPAQPTDSEHRRSAAPSSSVRPFARTDVGFGIDF